MTKAVDPEQRELMCHTVSVSVEVGERGTCRITKAKEDAFVIHPFPVLPQAHRSVHPTRPPLVLLYLGARAKPGTRLPSRVGDYDYCRVLCLFANGGGMRRWRTR